MEEAVEYPFIRPGKKGFIVQTGPKAELPGYYIKEIYAQRAKERHIAAKTLAAQKRRTRKNGGDTE